MSKSPLRTKCYSSSIHVSETLTYRDGTCCSVVMVRSSHYMATVTNFRTYYTLIRKLEMNNNETNSDNVLQTTHSDTNTRHSAETSEDFFVHFTERPVNSYRNQIFFKLAQQEQIYEKSPFPRHHRTTICKNSFISEEIELYLRKFHDGKQSAIYAPESLLQLIQEVCRTYSTDVLSHLVIAPNLVEDVVLDDDKYEIIQPAHNRAHRGIQEIE